MALGAQRQAGRVGVFAEASVTGPNPISPCFNTRPEKSDFVEFEEDGPVFFFFLWGMNPMPFGRIKLLKA